MTATGCAATRPWTGGTTGRSTTRSRGPTEAATRRRYSLIPTTCFNCEACCGLVAYVDKDSGRIDRLEGNPYHPASRGRNCAKGPATINQVYDPERILYPLKRAGRRGEGELGADHLGPGAGRDRRPHRHGDPGGPWPRGDVPRRPAGRRQLHRARAARLGAGRAQLAHQHLLLGSAARLRELDGVRPALARPRQRPRHLPHLVPPGGGALLQPACAADHRGATARRQGHLCRPPPVQHRLDGRPLAPGVARHGAGAAAGPGPAAARERHLGPGVRAALGQLGDVPPRDPTGPPVPVRLRRAGAARAVRRLHARAGGDRVRPRRAPDP